MRKRIHFRQLGRSPSHKMAMLRNMVTSLIEHERIVTTTAKAKEVQRLAENIVTMAKRGTQRAAMVLQNMSTTSTNVVDTNTVTVTDTPGTGSTPTPSTGTTNTTAGTLHIVGTTEPSASTSTPDHNSSSSSSGNQEKHRYTSAMAPLLHAHRQIGRIVRTDVMVQKVMNVLRHRYDARVGGYTRVLKLSKPRAGDNADMAIIEYVDHSNEVRAARPPDASTTTTTKVQPPQLSSIQLQQQLETLRNLYVANKAPRRYLVKNNLVPPPPTE